VRSVDLTGNIPAISQDMLFTTLGELDTQAPTIIAGPTITVLTDQCAQIEWRTNETARAQIEYGTDNAYGTVIDMSRYSEYHSMLLRDLTPDTEYHFRITGWDASENGQVLTEDMTFRTLSLPETDPPIITWGPGLSQHGSRSVLIGWGTDEPADSVIQYGKTEDYGLQISSGELVQDHAVVLSNLDEGAIYHFRVHSVDAAGNGPVSSADGTFMLPFIEVQTAVPKGMWMFLR
jgi:hypothetical protein